MAGQPASDLGLAVAPPVVARFQLAMHKMESCPHKRTGLTHAAFVTFLAYHHISSPHRHSDLQHITYVAKHFREVAQPI